MISSGRNSRCCFPFTASQWQELEHQLLTFKYITSGVPVPPELISTFLTNTSCSSRLFPHQQSLPFGWGCFQLGNGRKIDPEPGRCRRTDGKKWRCSKEACLDSKYCEKHIHRGKSKSKKNIQVFSTSPKSTTDAIFSAPSPATVKPCFSSSSAMTYSASPSHVTCYSHMAEKAHLYPFLSPQSSSFSTNCNDQLSLNNAAPQWFLDGQSYDQPKKELRYMNEMNGAGNEKTVGPFQDIRYNKVNKVDKEERYEVDTEVETQKLFHQFLGDWPIKSYEL